MFVPLPRYNNAMRCSKHWHECASKENMQNPQMTHGFDWKALRTTVKCVWALGGGGFIKASQKTTVPWTAASKHFCKYPKVCSHPPHTAIRQQCGGGKMSSEWLYSSYFTLQTISVTLAAKPSAPYECFPGETVSKYAPLLVHFNYNASLHSPSLLSFCFTSTYNNERWFISLVFSISPFLQYVSYMDIYYK